MRARSGAAFGVWCDQSNDCLEILMHITQPEHLMDRQRLFRLMIKYEVTQEDMEAMLNLMLRIWHYDISRDVEGDDETR